MASIIYCLLFMLMYSERYLLYLLVALHLEELILHLHETYKENCTKTATKSKVATESHYNYRYITSVLRCIRHC